MKLIVKGLSVLVVCLAVFSCNSGVKESENQEEQPQEQPLSAVTMVTTKGTISINLYNETPLHRDNFLKLAREGKFDSLLFHRVIPNFMIQGGDPDSKNSQANDTLGDGDLNYTVKAEFNPDLYHKRGVLAAARDDNPGKESSAMQFYIVQGRVYNDSLLTRDELRINRGFAVDYFKGLPNKNSLLDSLQQARDSGNFDRYNAIADSLLSMATASGNYTYYNYPEYQREVYKTEGGTPWLDQGYTVFGEVTQGMEVVDSIAGVKTNPLNRPEEDVRILSVQVVEQ